MRSIAKLFSFFILSTCLSSSHAEGDSLATALENYVDEIRAMQTHLREGACFKSDSGPQRAYLHLMRSVIKSIEEEVLQDPDFPYFRVIDFNARTGGDNPDQRYLTAPIRGGVAYRVWGNLGSAKRLEVQLYAGEPWTGKGRSAGYLAFEDIRIEKDGTFSVELTPKEVRESSTLHNPSDSTAVMVRQIYDDWSREYPGEVHIDRIGYEGKAKPEPTAENVAARLRNAAANLYSSTAAWPDLVQKQYASAREHNVLPDLMSVYQLGGVEGRWMTGTYFSIPEGQALIIKTWPTQAAYQAIQLTDCYFASLEYGNRTSSFTSRQSVAAPDGAYYHIISKEDPGYGNWLDPVGLSEGVVLLRYDGVNGDIPSEKWPSARLVDQEDLANVIPGFLEEQISADERALQFSERRKHLQIRLSR